MACEPESVEMFYGYIFSSFAIAAAGTPFSDVKTERQTRLTLTVPD